METKPKLDFSQLIDIEECKKLIRDCIADLASERALLEKAKTDPQPLDEQSAKLLGLGPNHGMTTLDVAEARVSYYEAAQERLWQWYRKLTDG